MLHAVHNDHHANSELESDEEESEDEEELEEEQEPQEELKPMHKKLPSKMLSKKEQRQKELDELNAALNEFGIDKPKTQSQAGDAEGINVEVKSVAKKKSKKKSKQKKSTNNAIMEKDQPPLETTDAVSLESPLTVTKNIKDILKAKMKKKKGPSSSSRLAQEAIKMENLKKNKKKKNKGNLNEMPY